MIVTRFPIMKIIEIRPSKKFGGSWMAFEAPGVEPCYPGATGKHNAIGYAKTRFGGIPKGEIHVYDEAGEKIVETIKMDGGTQFGQPTP